MISDTRGLRQAGHGSICGSAASRGKGAPPGVLGLVLTKWRLASTDAGRHEALGFPALSGFVNTSAWLRQRCSHLGMWASWTHVHSSRSWNFARSSHHQLKMELQSVCLFAL